MLATSILFFKKIFISLIFLSVALTSNAQTSKAIVLNIDGAIGPATADYVERGINQAVTEHAALIIIRLDTPGGLDKSMRSIIEAMLNSTIPIAVYVAPSGARAASAGTFILYASHIAAMAPGTNIGAASPVSIGGSFPSTNDSEKKSEKTTMQKKISNDALAFIRSLAELHHRNIEFAEQAVKSAATLTAQEALQKKVIEIMARDIPDLLKQMNNRTVLLQGKSILLKTENLNTVTIAHDWRTQLLTVITDPSIAYILLLIGIYGLFFEFANPGFVMPGVTGAIALLLALYAFQLLPVNYVGLGLIFLGIIFLVMEAFMPSFGALGIGGVIAFIVGSVLLFDPNLAGYHIAWPLIFAMAIINGAFFFFVMGMALKARRKKIVSGREELIGMTGVVVEDMNSSIGQAIIHGELWKIESTELLKRGTVVKVVGINGLLLKVTRVVDNQPRSKE